MKKNSFETYLELKEQARLAWHNVITDMQDVFGENVTVMRGAIGPLILLEASQTDKIRTASILSDMGYKDGKNLEIMTRGEGVPGYAMSLHWPSFGGRNGIARIPG